MAAANISYDPVQELLDVAARSWLKKYSEAEEKPAAKSLDSLLRDTVPVWNAGHGTEQESRYSPAAYITEIRPAALYGGFYPRSDLSNFILALNMPLVPFGETGFYGVTFNMAFPQRNTTTTRGDRTQELLTDSHEMVLHVVLKMDDGHSKGHYDTRALQAAMFPRKSELPLDRYAREAIYRN